jgi:predicted AlkP superfamily pyrophosphatase or phosphodiesterase
MTLKILLAVSFAFCGLAASQGATRLVDRVVVIGLDGCRPEAIQEAAGPVLRDLYENGSVSWKAQAVAPTVTQVNFASILTGCVPEKHGIVDVKWEHGNTSLHVKVPTIFQVLADQKLTSAGFLGHEKLYPSESQGEGIYCERSPGSAKGAAQSFLKYLETNKPDFSFIYMGNLDGAGHKYGWLSAEQFSEMYEIDAAIGAIIGGLKKAGLWEGTLLLITSDHGGHDKSHSQGLPVDFSVPVVCYGKAVKPGYEIQKSVHNFDVAATALYALGVPIPPNMDAQPITEIFLAKP